ncbi:MAG TPA: ABC transporter ATP-binding protein [Limnochordia bacterium]|nr:ABC transporter ATP-binding protein [Limnochordia bacterium]
MVTPRAAASGAGNPPTVKPRVSAARTFARMVTLMLRVRPVAFCAYWLLAFAGAAFPSLTTLLLIRLFAAGADYVAGASAFAELVRAAALYAALQLGQGVFNMVRARGVASLQRSLVAALHEQLYQKATRLRLEAFERPALYDRMAQARAAVDSNRFLDQMRRAAYSVQYALGAAGLSGVLIHLNPWLALSLAVAAVPVAIQRWVRGTKFYHLAQFQTARRRLLDYYAELLRDRAAAKEVRVFGLGEYLLGRWGRLRAELRDERWAFERRSLVVEALFSIATTEVFAFGFAVAVAVSAALNGALGVAAFAGTVSALRTFQDEVRYCLIDLIYATTGAQYVADLFAFLDDPEEEPPPGSGRALPAPLKTGIAAAGVGFTYPGAAAPALQGIDLHIRPGERLAIVGANGAGKSTLVKLLLGLYRPTAGRITYDGIDLQEFDPAALRRQLAAVFQDFQRYHYTVRENIGFGDLTALGDDPAIAEASARGGADAVIQAWPAGLATRLGPEFPDGVDLSGGQWQRLAAARGFMRTPQVLALDEPTASLDPLREAELFQRFGQMATGRTTLLVSHRLGSCRLCDRILVLAGGRLVEQGTHTELLAAKGPYSRLWAEQAHWYR